MTKSTLIVFYGGTFDPIHYGHLKSVTSLANILNLKKIIFLINNIPLYRSPPIASFCQRIDMVNLAISNVANKLFVIKKNSLHRKTLFWTVDTFKVLRQQYGFSVPLAFVIGQDSFLMLSKWKCSWKLSKLCHLLVCARHGYDHQSSNQYNNSNYSLTHDPHELYHKPAGLIYYASTPKLAISSSNIRQRYREGLSCEGLLPSSVQDYINKERLYR